MDDHAVYDFGRGEHEQAVEVQIAFGAAAAPSGLLLSDGDSAWMDAEKRGIVGDALRDVFLRLRYEMADVVFAQEALAECSFASLLMQSHLLADPVLVRRNHALDLALACAHGSPHQQTFVCDLKPDRFSFAADYSVVHADILSSEGVEGNEFR